MTSRTFSFYYPRTRPQGTPRCLIVSSTNARYEDWNNLPAEEYEANKRRLIETTLDALDKYVPDCRQRIDYVEAATPNTFEHYTKHPAGTSFGTKFEGLAISRGLPEQIGGLYHAGSVGIIMSGWLGAINYGVIVANDVDALLTRYQPLRGEFAVDYRGMFMNRQDIENALPHRPPMLLVDEVVRGDDESIVCRKTFHESEFFFQGHYPRFPLVPGVILCECAMQAGGLLLASRLGNAAGVPVATRMDQVRFRRMVRPGETVEIEVQLRDQVSQAFYLEARVRCEGKLAARLDFACTLTELASDED